MKNLAIAALAAFVLIPAFSEEPSRCTIGQPKFMSWAPRNRPWKVENGVLTLSAKKDKACSFDFNDKNDSALLAAYAGGPGYRVSFKYRSDVKAKVHYVITTMESPKCPCRHEKAIPVSAQWKDFSCDLVVPQQDCEGISLSLECGKGEDGTLEVKDFSVVDVPPADKSGRPLLVNGAKAAEICLYRNDTPMRRKNDLRAAFMFRFGIRATGGEWLPIREVEKSAEAGANAVLVGRLAVDAGVVAAAEEAKVEGLTGGWAIAAKGTRLGLAGAVPGGVQRGVRSVLEKLGVVYLGSDMFKPVATDAFATDEFAETVLPATAFPLAGDRNGMNVELRGWIPMELVFGDHAIGSLPEAGRLTCDSLGYIIAVGEFRETHPEFFALQKDGTRLTDDAHARGLTHFCWTAPGLAELLAERYLEMMRALPHQPVWIVAPGDGGGLNCTCEKCKAIGSDSDGLVRLANKIAEIISKEFPQNRIWIYSYVDTPEPPKTPVKAHPNLNIGYCVYPTEYWPSCMLLPHPANAKGEKALADWRKEVCPDLSLVAYYSQCGEWLNYWPGFDADVWLTRDFAEHRNLLTYRFGLHTTHRAGFINQASGFTDLIIYVLSRLEVDPKADERKLAYEFLDVYYGAAAKPMREFFDMAMAEPKKRDWVQGCEQHLKGFVTKGFAAKALPLLDEAERLCGDDKALRSRVRKEMIEFLWSYLDGVGRGRGNVSAKEVKPWAECVAQFARLCTEEGGSYMGGLEPANWFHDNCMYEINTKGRSDWTKAPEIKKLIEDPVKALGGEFPNMQKKTADGYRIPASGMMGGILQKKCFWRNKEGFDVRIARRESSGLGLVFTRLDLDEVPKGEVEMILKGIDNEKEAVAEIEVAVNASVIYKGPVKWSKAAHTEWTLKLPAGLLHAGSNEIQLKNPTPDNEKNGEGGDAFRATRNYFWGWFMLDSVSFRHL